MGNTSEKPTPFQVSDSKGAEAIIFCKCSTNNSNEPFIRGTFYLVNIV